jgi:hypothetical protein
MTIRFQAEVGSVVFATRVPPMQRAAAALAPRLKQPEREADHSQSAPFSAEACVYLHGGALA